MALQEVDRLWKEKAFTVEDSPLEEERIERTLSLLPTCTGKRIVDLGAGMCFLSKRIKDAGGDVLTLDCHDCFLVAARDLSLKARKETLPFSTLSDNAFDLVICTDVIAYLHPLEYRLLLSETARLVTREGKVLLSTPLDIDAEDALERFIALCETEFTIDRVGLSHGALYIRLARWIPFPKKWQLRLYLALEKLGRVFFGDKTASHVIVVGHKKPLF